MYIIAALLLGMLIGTLTTMVGWVLFAVPVFKLAPLTFSQAFGLYMISLLFRSSEKIYSSVRGQ